MELRINRNTFLIFDLDDTLFYEIDFLKSAYRHISSTLQSHIGDDIYEEMFRRYQEKENVFEWIVKKYAACLDQKDVSWLLKEYREHEPQISLAKETAAFLEEMYNHNIPMGLITDGRSVTQRNKLKALGITQYFSDIIISEEFGSEKPDPRNYKYFEDKYPSREFYFFGDNTKKDFLVPCQLGWNTVCLRNKGYNIHEQVNCNPSPGNMINGFDEITIKYIDENRVQV